MRFVVHLGLAAGLALALLSGLHLVTARAATLSLAGASTTSAAPAAHAGRAPARLGAAFYQSATWSGFYPAGWTNHVPLASGVTVNDPAGLDVGSAAFRTTANAGATWTDWTANGLNITVLGAGLATLEATGLTFPDSETDNRIQFSIRNQAGATQISDVYAIAVDTTPPLPPSNLHHFPATWTNVNSFRETWTNPNDLSGIAGAYYRLNSVPTSPTDGTFVTTNYVDNIQVPGEGVHSILIWLVDGAGNIDQNEYRVDLGAFRYDETPPVVGVTRDGPLGSNGWYTDTVRVTFSPVDALSGIASWDWRLDAQPPSQAISVAITANLHHTLVVTATDHAGNPALPSSYTISIDDELPVLAHTFSVSPSVSGWYTAPVRVTFTVSDAVSGPAAPRWQVDNQPYTPGYQTPLLTDGRHTLRAYGQDAAGNHSPLLTLNLPVDTWSPSTTLSLAPQVAPSGYYTAPVSGQFTATDQPPGAPAGSGSGILITWMRVNGGAWQQARPLFYPADGRYQLDYFSVDRAGNMEISRTRTILVDATPPAAPVVPSITPANWSPTNQFTLRWQNPGDSSGIHGAYVFLGQGPPPPGGGVFYPAGPQSIALNAPDEGDWPVWMWLVDGAGNRGTPANVGSLRFDGTPPQVQIDTSGPQGHAGWFTGTIQVTLTNADAGSGPADLRYRLDGSAWQQTSLAQATLQVNTPGKHVLDYSGTDVAGHTAGPYLEVLRLDPDAPDAPIALVVTPTGWTNDDDFLLTWRNPLDASGVAVARFSFQPPASPGDGQAVPASDQTAAAQAPAEGSYTLHMWLEDVAGNVDIDQRAILVDALRYDATPPVTAMQFAPPANAGGWFRSDVTVTFDAADSLSGVSTTTWELDGQAPVTGTQAAVTGDGVHTLRVHSTDWAGNVEVTTETTLRIDSQAPTAALQALSTYSPNPAVSVRWTGSDPAAEAQGAAEPESSGLAGFDVQVKVGAAGAWQPWLSRTTQTEAEYPGQRGQVYAFRARAVDVAGNTSAWNDAGGQNRTLVDPVQNGAFVTQNWEGWTTHDELGLTLIQETDLIPGQIVPAGRLGSSTWQACSAPGNLPTLQCEDDWSGISQTIRVPSLQDVPKPTLDVWYRVQTYDQTTTNSSVWSTLCPQLPGPPFLVDTFDVTAQVVGSSQVAVLLRDGNTQPQFPLPIEFRDLGWRKATIDMKSYAGKTVNLRLSSHNRLDSRFNTWTDVYGIRLHGAPKKTFLPLMPQNSSTTPPPPPVCWPQTAPNAESSVKPAATPAGQLEGSPR